MNQGNSRTKLLGVALAALGIVLGDIGTSPLYALRECLHHMSHGNLTPALVLGPVSLMIWSFILIVSVKYVGILARATSQGEGGVFALFSLLKNDSSKRSKAQIAQLSFLTILGAALFYGDGMITPAISVLSAVEGLKEISPQTAPYVVGITVSILLGLFALQKHGTQKLGITFGPILLIWFLTLGIAGLCQVVKMPEVLSALSPHHGILLFVEHPGASLIILGAVLLCVTGSEALYADLGHFSAASVRLAWLGLAMPCLMLNYLGQSALILRDPSAAENPFFRMFPSSLLPPVVLLATIATIIASQAMITGVFSLTHQAMQLGYLPRLKVKHTNPDVRGQVFLPQVNFLLCLACVMLVILFESSSALASAYGLSIAANMLLTSVLLGLVMKQVWKWSTPVIAASLGVFLVIETGFFLGCLTKLFHLGWLPVLTTIFLATLMKTWWDGRQIQWQNVKKHQIPVEHLVSELEQKHIPRIRGTGVFMTGASKGLPLVLLHHLKHNKALHERIILLTVTFHEVPFVSIEERIQKETISHNFDRVVIHYGFSEHPDVMSDLCAALGYLKTHQLSTISFYQARELLLPTGRSDLAPWRKHLFIQLSRIARPATGYFHLPSRQVIELGIQMEI